MKKAKPTKYGRQTGVRPMSTRLRIESSEYMKLKKQEYANLPGKKLCCVLGCSRPAEKNPHHKWGRTNKLLCDVRGWTWPCWPCHHKVKEDPTWAREVGLLPPVGQYGSWQAMDRHLKGLRQ